MEVVHAQFNLLPCVVRSTHFYVLACCWRPVSQVAHLKVKERVAHIVQVGDKLSHQRKSDDQSGSTDGIHGQATIAPSTISTDSLRPGTALSDMSKQQFYELVHQMEDGPGRVHLIMALFGLNRCVFNM